VDYFLYQLACGLLELIALVLLNKRHNKFTYTKTSFIEKVKSIKFHYKFALYSAFGVISWIAVTSVDKLLISRFFSLENFSAFSIGVMGASVFLYLSGPLSNSLIPRFTEVFEKEGLNALKSILENLLNLSLVLLLPLSIYASFFSEEVLLLWTGNEEIAAEAKIILSFYSMGNVIALLSSFVYFLQAAKGELKLHFIGSTLFMVIYLPTLLFFIDAFGLVGSGYAWFIVNLILFLTWSGYVFKTHMSGFYFQWLYKVFLPSILISYILVYFEYCIYLLFPEKIFLLSLTPVFFCFNSVVLYLFLYGPTKEPFSYLTN
jgi:O-antigen/teichoic acid export membrane protein